jgi:hypothetical protein
MEPKVQDHIVEGIKKHGHMLVAAEDFIYTVGNAQRGLPELLMLGNYDPRMSGTILNALTDKMVKDGESLPEGMVDIDWTFPFKVRKASQLAKMKYTVQVGQVLGHERYDVLQVMVCDKEGRYPGDEDCHPDYVVSFA